MKNPTSRSKRKWKNYYLSPSIQTRYALINAASVLFGIWALSALIFDKLQLIFNSAVNSTPLPVDPNDLINYVVWSFIGVCVGMGLFAFLLSIVITHRTVGPVYAFERHLRSLLRGDYKSRINLRKRDDFRELSRLLNEVAEKLENSERT